MDLEMDLSMQELLGGTSYRHSFMAEWQNPPKPSLTFAAPPGRWKLYLAGPIAGMHVSQAEAWRDKVKAMLPPEIVAYSPLRGKRGALENLDRIGVQPLNHTLATDRAIMRRDHYDCISSDLVLCNLLGAKSKSIGTCFELAWAYDRQIPVVLVMEPTGNLHDHPMVREAHSYRVDSLEEAVRVVKAVLLP